MKDFLRGQVGYWVYPWLLGLGIVLIIPGFLLLYWARLLEKWSGEEFFNIDVTLTVPKKDD